MKNKPPSLPSAQIKQIARIALGLVWLYEGLVPKIFFVDHLPQQTALVLRSGIWLVSPEATLIALGVAQTLLGVVLIAGWWERAAVLIATAAMGALIILVATGKPDMLIDPFGALAKDFCLIACAAIVWILAKPAPVR